MTKSMISMFVVDVFNCMLYSVYAYILCQRYLYIYRSNVGAPAGFEHDPPPAGVIRWQWGELPGPEATTEDRGVSAVTQGGHQSPHPANPQVKQGQGQCMCETGFGRPMT